MAPMSGVACITIKSLSQSTAMRVTLCAGTRFRWSANDALNWARVKELECGIAVSCLG
jgi:hypothetical protein